MFRMWIKTIMIMSCVVAALAADGQRSKKKDDARSKRNLQYNIAHHYNGPHSYRLERRISTGPQIPLYHSQFFPGPIRSYSPYHKGRPHSLPPPPYAVQMEPLIHYSQRDPLYAHTNTLSLNADGQDDLLTDNNHVNANVYGPQKHIIERPVYIKEPEPIIEIIIKESNVTLPPPPTPPSPPPKKKEQVQVFYVKYKKNPNGHGKDSIIYDKPVPAISPPVEDEHEESPPQTYHHQEVVTSPPPPSTTLRTIIKPDSETYHSPSGIKVTFGKEGFDYAKRSNKPEDFKPSSDHQFSLPQGRQLNKPEDLKASSDHQYSLPQGRQLSSFPTGSPRRPSTQSFNSAPSSFRQPQPYRPFGQYKQQTLQSFSRPTQQEYSTLPKFGEFSQPPKNNQQFPPPRPVPPQFQRQPVPYQPFESLRNQPPVQFRPETHFPVTQAPPVTQKPASFNQRPPFGASRPRFSEPKPQPKPSVPQYQFPNRQQPAAPQYSQQPQGSQYQQPVAPHFEQRPTLTQHQQFSQPQQFDQRPSFPQHQQPATPQFEQRPQYQPQYQQQLPQHQAQSFNVIPPGGELVQSVPKYEQHISVSEASKTPQQPQFINNQQPQYHIQPQIQQSSIQLSSNDQSKQSQSRPQQSSNHPSSSEYNDRIQQQLREANSFQESVRQSSLPYYNFQQSQQLDFYRSTSKPSTYTTTPKSTTYSTTTTTTTTTQKPSTTTKDPKLLNAQLPDEVPEDLRQQLLSSGILNNADISVLDYDKVGDIPLSALPPDQLANFYNAGGGQQIQTAGSAPIPAIAPNEFDAEASEIREVKVKPEVQMKVVRYDPESDRGQRVQEAYVDDDATQVEPVVLNDEKYNRYLPLKVNGAQFPIPNVPELKGKKISSVVVLAPVAYDFSSSRKKRAAKDEKIELVEKELLKVLLKSPTKENFQKFLEKENQTKSEQQAVILLVTGTNDNAKDKEIFMYDVATQTVSKLDGELSSAFVDAAEANAEADTKTSASNIVETRVPYNMPVIDPEHDLETEASEYLESFVDVSGTPLDEDLTASETNLSILGTAKTGRWR